MIYKNYTAIEHSSFAYLKSNRRTCDNYKETGHIRRDYSISSRKRKLRFTLLDAEIDAGETIEIELTEYTVPIPIVSKA